MPTLATMRAQVLREADLLDGQVDDPDVDALLNDELAALHEILVNAHESYAVTTATLTIAAGADSVALPASFFRALDLENIASLTRPVTVPAMEWRERNSPTFLGWCIQGQTLLLRPSASAPATYRLTYVPAYTMLVLDTDIFTAPNGWEVFAILGAAIRLRNVQELSASGLEDRRKAVETRILNAAQKRIGPRKVRDVRGTGPARRRPDDDWGY